MIESHQNGLTFFQFPHLAACAGLRHAVFTRKGGFSDGLYQSLNVGLNVGDKTEVVNKNRRLVGDCLGFDKTIFVRQVHGADLLLFSNADVVRGGFLEGLAASTADALVTDATGVLLAIQTADCQAVLLYDPVLQVMANVHAGWRGSVANIIGQTVAAMKADFKCRPADILAAVGPSLGPCCAEFVNYRDELPPFVWDYQIADNHFDFWALSKDQLKTAGVKGDNIHIGGLCTKCRQDLFFSYRGAKSTGRFAAVVGMFP